MIDIALSFNVLWITWTGNCRSWGRGGVLAPHSGCGFRPDGDQGWLAALAHPWLISAQTCGVRKSSLKGCQDISPEWSEAHLGCEDGW